MADKKHDNKENEILSWAEVKLGSIRPYTNQIVVGVIVLLAAFGAILLYVHAQNQSDSTKWRELNFSWMDSVQNQNTSRLLEVATDYPDQSAGLWALMLAGDFDLRSGLAVLSTDRPAGFKMVKKAKSSFKRIVDSSGANRSTDLFRRSLYSLAYSEETLGEFKRAGELYKQLSDAAPDSAYAMIALRGLARCENPSMAAAYQQFLDWKDPSGQDAPGPNLPARPDIEIPEFNFGDDRTVDPATVDGEANSSAEKPAKDNADGEQAGGENDEQKADEKSADGGDSDSGK